MPAQIVPLTTAPNQTMRVTLAINGTTLTLNLAINYNEVGQFWILSVFDTNLNPLVQSLPLVSGQWPAANLFSAFEYLQIGEIYVINQNGGAGDWPDKTNLGSQWLLLWTDNTDS